MLGETKVYLTQDHRAKFKSLTQFSLWGNGGPNLVGGMRHGGLGRGRARLLLVAQNKSAANCIAGHISTALNFGLTK
jgi:hypothetical protein